MDSFGVNSRLILIDTQQRRLKMLTITNEMEKKLAYSVEEISKQTTLSKAYLRNEIRAGHLKVQRFGRRVLVLNDDLQNYLKREVKAN
jgi:excisionase family DNA binding protein